MSEWACVCHAVNDGRLCEHCGRERPLTPIAILQPPQPDQSEPPLDEESRRALMAELLPKLEAMDARILSLRPSRRKWNGERTEAAGDPCNESHIPFPRGTTDDLAWRAQKAAHEIARLRAYCDREGIPWRSDAPHPPTPHQEETPR
jgi:hypothetical protein